MALADALRKAANAIITNSQFGVAATLVHQSSGTYDPSTGVPAVGDEPESVTVIFVDSEGHETTAPERDGVSGSTGVPEVIDVLIAASDVVCPPARRDVLECGGKRWQIVRVATAEVAGIAIQYRCQLRR